MATKDLLQNVDYYGTGTIERTKQGNVSKRRIPTVKGTRPPSAYANFTKQAWADPNFKAQYKKNLKGAVAVISSEWKQKQARGEVPLPKAKPRSNYYGPNLGLSLKEKWAYAKENKDEYTKVMNNKIKWDMKKVASIGRQ
jgi:hypothetical protein